MRHRRPTLTLQSDRHRRALEIGVGGQTAPPEQIRIRYYKHLKNATKSFFS